jgi:hypothetical protein
LAERVVSSCRTVTAYIAGPQAGHYDFTSALAVHVLRVLEPVLMPLIRAPTGKEARRTKERVLGALP